MACDGYKYTILDHSLRRGLLLLLFLFSILCYPVAAQSDKGLITPENLLRNWKVAVKGGTVMLISEVPVPLENPRQYLQYINNMNIPVWKPGIAGTLTTRKMLSAHWEMGYQLELLQLRGEAMRLTTTGSRSVTSVRTTGVGQNFTIGYVFREAWINNPKTNYTLAYKVGSLHINNRDERDQNAPNGNVMVETFSNVAVITGLVNEFTFNLNRDLSLMLTAEFNRSSDTPRDIYKPYKLFYYSSHTVNNFINISVGLSYQFGFVKNKINKDPKNLPWYKRKR